MFDNEDDDFESWWLHGDESEIDKLRRKALQAEEKERKEYIRFKTLYDYFKSASGISKQYVFYNKDNVRNLKKMLALFIEHEEYEKCANVRDWIIEVEELHQKWEEKKNKKEKTPEKPITF